MIYVKYISNKFQLNFTSQQIDEYLSWIVVGVIVGGRLGYCMVYDFHKYMNNPVEILQTYMGGMSFHGGVFGVIVSTWIFTKRHKVNFWIITDLCAVAAPIGIFLGRLANFVNAELRGRITDVQWGVIFPGEFLARHPSQIYEALCEGIVLGCILYYLAIKKRMILTQMYLSGSFLLWYGILRTFCELFREADSQTGYFIFGATMGQLLSSIMILSGVYIIGKSITRA
jgi:phosphatidylglycerol:prolipoprotein diacylglycerol transferase